MTKTVEETYSWPNILTFVRIGAIPLLVVLYYLPTPWSHTVAAIIFLAASFTDWLDGYLARYLKQTTKLGMFLDPVADKLLVSIALVLIVAEPIYRELSPAMIAIPAAIIVSRELIVSALREWMAELGKRKSVAVSNLGKVKTFVQMVALTVLLYCNQTTEAIIIHIGLILLYAAAVLTIWSMFFYLKAALNHLSS